MLEQLLALLLSGGGYAGRAGPALPPSSGYGNLGSAMGGAPIDPMTGLPLEGIGRPPMAGGLPPTSIGIPGGFRGPLTNFMPPMGGLGADEQQVLRFLVQQSLGGAPRRYAPGYSPARPRPQAGRLDLSSLLDMFAPGFAPGMVGGVAPSAPMSQPPVMATDMDRPFDRF